MDFGKRLTRLAGGLPTVRSPGGGSGSTISNVPSMCPLGIGALAPSVTLEVWAASQERLCRCGHWATSELSYAKDMEGQQNASLTSSSSGTPPSSPPTDQSYQTPMVEQVTVLVPVPEDIQLPSPNTSEEETLCVPPPRAPTPGHQVGGQRC